MPYINVDEAYILDNTGLQVDQSVDYANANSNRNLLDNPWFTNPVNQRGAASLPASAYGIDRWKGGSTGSVSVTSSGLAFGSSGGNAWQPVESALRTWGNGKVFTASVLLSNGTVYSGSGTLGSGTTYFLSNPIELFMSSAGNFNIRTTSAYTIAAVKLELGSYSTLINDTPPDYGEELKKCQRYFVRLVQAAPLLLGGGFCTSGGGSFVVLIPTPVPMRAVTSVIGQGAFSLAHGTTRTNFNTVSVSQTQQNGVVVSGSGTVTANAPCYLFCNNTGYVDIIADL